MPEPATGGPCSSLIFVGRVRDDIRLELKPLTPELLVGHERARVHRLICEPVSRATLGVELDSEETVLFCVWRGGAGDGVSVLCAATKQKSRPRRTQSSCRPVRVVLVRDVRDRHAALRPCRRLRHPARGVRVREVRDSSAAMALRP